MPRSGSRRKATAWNPAVSDKRLATVSCALIEMKKQNDALNAELEKSKQREHGLSAELQKSKQTEHDLVEQLDSNNRVANSFGNQLRESGRQVAVLNRQVAVLNNNLLNIQQQLSLERNINNEHMRQTINDARQIENLPLLQASRLRILQESRFQASTTNNFLPTNYAEHAFQAPYRLF